MFPRRFWTNIHHNCRHRLHSFALPPASVFAATHLSHMLSGLINSSCVSVEVQPATSASTITLAAVYNLGLLPKLDRFGRYTCDVPLSIPTHTGFYTCQMPLQCSHARGGSDVVLGWNWMSATGSVFCDNSSTLLDPPQSVIASLPNGYYWSPNKGEVVRCLEIAIH